MIYCHPKLYPGTIGQLETSPLGSTIGRETDCCCRAVLCSMYVCLCAVWAVWLCVAVCGCVAVWLCAVCCVLHATATAQTMQLELGSPEAAFIAFMVFMAFAAFVAFVLFTVAGLLLADAMASTSESCDAGS